MKYREIYMNNSKFVSFIQYTGKIWEIQSKWGCERGYMQDHVDNQQTTGCEDMIWRQKQRVQKTWFIIHRPGKNMAIWEIWTVVPQKWGVHSCTWTYGNFTAEKWCYETTGFGNTTACGLHISTLIRRKITSEISSFSGDVQGVSFSTPCLRAWEIWQPNKWEVEMDLPPDALFLHTLCQVTRSHAVTVFSLRIISYHLCSQGANRTPHFSSNSICKGHLRHIGMAGSNMDIWCMYITSTWINQPFISNLL